jgi:hypothetical protein
VGLIAISLFGGWEVKVGLGGVWFRGDSAAAADVEVTGASVGAMIRGDDEREDLLGELLAGEPREAGSAGDTILAASCVDLGGDARRDDSADFSRLLDALGGVGFG